MLAHLADYLMRKGDIFRRDRAANDTLRDGAAARGKAAQMSGDDHARELGRPDRRRRRVGSAADAACEAEWLIDECGASIYRARLNEARALLAVQR